MGRPGLLGLWILGKKKIREVVGVVMVRFFAATGNSCWFSYKIFNRIFLQCFG